jgi:hypothetical protein
METLLWILGEVWANPGLYRLMYLVIRLFNYAHVASCISYNVVSSEVVI